MNLDLITYRRAVYNLLEWVSQIGGLSSALFNVYFVIFKVGALSKKYASWKPLGRITARRGG